MSVGNYKELKDHIGHQIVVVGYRNPNDKNKVIDRLTDEKDYENVAIECEDCNEVLLDFDIPENE